MYCIVFSGRLLDGYDPQIVRQAVANRLKLDANQVERLFCGRRVVLKKGVTEESARLYLAVLRRLGMDAGMARTARSADTVQALATFKVVFWGDVVPGFAREAVMQAAAARLKASPAQIGQIFGGTKAVLKRHVSAETGTRYVTELARIGMQIELEVETVEVPVPPPERPASAARSTPRGPRLPGFRRHDDEPYAALLQTQFELPPSTDMADAPDATAPLVVPPPQFPRARQSPQPVATASPIVVPPPKPVAEYIRCEQCGHRQMLGARCRVCGSELKAAAQVFKPMPMDASAYATPTTVLGNMPAGLLRSSVANPARPGDDDLAAMLRVQAVAGPRVSLLRGHAPALLGAALVVSVVMWLIW